MLCMTLNNPRFYSFLPVILLAVSVISCTGKSSESGQKPNPPVIVDVMVASLEKVDNTIEANGTIIANENVELHPEISGRLTYLNIPEGKGITKLASSKY